MHNWIICSEQSLTFPELGRIWQLSKLSRDSGWDTPQPFPGGWVCMGVFLYSIPWQQNLQSTTNYFQQCVEEGRGLQKANLIQRRMWELPNRLTRVTGKQGNHQISPRVPEDDTGIKRTAQAVWLYQKLNPDQSSVLPQPCGLGGSYVHDFQSPHMTSS